MFEELLNDPEFLAFLEMQQAQPQQAPQAAQGRYQPPASHYPGGPGPRPSFEMPPTQQPYNPREIQRLVSQLKGVPQAIQTELIRRQAGMRDPAEAVAARQAASQAAITERQTTLQNQRLDRQDEAQTRRETHQTQQLDKRFAQQTAENDKRFEQIVERIAPKTLNETQRKGISDSLGKLYEAGVTDWDRLQEAAAVMGAQIVSRTVNTGLNKWNPLADNATFEVGAKQSPAVQGQGKAKKPAAEAASGAPAPVQTAPQGRVRVQAPSGQTGHVPAEQVKAFEARGFKVIK